MKISKHCYVISGLAGPEHWLPIAGIVAGQEKTLVIDTGMTYMSGRTIWGYAQCIRPGNEIQVAITEPHFDHIGGNCFFREKMVDISAHKNARREADLIDIAKQELNQAIDNSCRRAAGEEDAFYINTTIANPNRAVAHGDQFDLGDVRVEVLGTPGHTPANLSYLVLDDRVLYCGDAIVTHYIPNLEAGTPGDWAQWLTSLDLIEKSDPDIIVPGHGDVVLKEDIPRVIRDIRLILKQAIASGKAPTQ